MSSLFSHATEPTPSDVPQPDPRIASVEVPQPINEAFDGFTDGIHLWWPLETHSTQGADAHVGFEKKQLIEDAFTGKQQLWAEVEALEAPTSLALKWYLGGNPLAPTRITITFSSTSAELTMVKLVHDGWSPGEAGVEQYEKYCDWPLILSRYARFMGAVGKLD